MSLKTYLQIDLLPLSLQHLQQQRKQHCMFLSFQWCLCSLSYVFEKGSVSADHSSTGGRWSRQTGCEAPPTTTTTTSSPLSLLPFVFPLQFILVCVTQLHSLFSARKCPCVPVSSEQEPVSRVGDTVPLMLLNAWCSLRYQFFRLKIWCFCRQASLGFCGCMRAAH